MNNFERRNIKLLNLVDAGLSGRTLLRIIDNCYDHYVTEEDIKRELGDTPTCKKTIEQFQLLDQSYYSIYCLLKFEINMIVIEKIRSNFKTLDSLSKNLKTLHSLHLHLKTEERIIDALKKLKLNYFVNLDKELFDEISLNGPCLNNQLKEKFLNKYPTLTVAEYDDAVDSLIKENQIINSFDGLKVKRVLLSDYISNANYQDIEIVIHKLQGRTLQQIAEQRGISRERVRQIIQKKISKFPIFFNEERYHKIMNLYDLSDIELEVIGLNDSYLIEYVKVKYKLSPHKNSLDYIVDFNISGTEQAREILKKNHLVLIDGDLIQEDFVQLMKKYVNIKSIYSFSLAEIKADYNMFLNAYCAENNELYIGNINDIVIKNRKLDNNTYFLAVGNQRYFVYRPDSLSSDFVEALNNFLNEFYGYGSMSLFYDNNQSLCNKNHIKSERELFVLTKALFGEKYADRIEFVRNPTFATKGINKEAFIENMILDMDLPCKIDDYLSYVNKATGLRKDTIYGQFSRTINQYKNSLGLITLDNEVTNEQYNYVKSIIGNSDCVGYSYLFDRVELRYGTDAQIILNNNNLRKIGFVKTTTSVYSDVYSNRLDAVINEIDKLDEFMISELELMKISNIEYFYYRSYDFIDTNTLLKVGKDKYLNIKKRNQLELIVELKKDILGLIKDEEVYVLNQFVESTRFKTLLEKNEDYKDLFLSFDAEEMLKNLILSMREINYIEASTSFIFSRRDLSINILIDDILKEYGALSLYDLKEILFDEFYIQKDLSNGELSDMGYYCPKSSEKVYLTKEFYEKELEDYLNGNS